MRAQKLSAFLFGTLILSGCGSAFDADGLPGVRACGDGGCRVEEAGLEVTVAEAALEEGVTIQIEVVESPAEGNTGFVYDITPDGLTFPADNPAELSFDVTTTGLPEGTVLADLLVARFEDGEWVALAGENGLNTAGTHVVAFTQHFSHYTLIGGRSRPAFLDGTVTATGGEVDGDPIVDATVTLSNANGLELATTSTDTEGHYVFEDLRAGRYNVAASKEGFDADDASVALGAGQSRTVDLELAVSADTPGRVDGVVLDVDGEPIEGASITLLSDALNETAITDAEGAYAFDPVPAGSYEILAAAEGFDPASGFIDVGPGERWTVDFQLEPSAPTTGDIAGQVVNAATGAPVSGALLQLVNDNGLLEETESNENGAFGFDGLAPGNYLVIAIADGFVPADFSVDVAPGETSEVELPLVPETQPGGVVGVVVDAANGQALAGATVRLVSPLQVVVFSTLTGNNGRFEITGVDPGAYVIEVELEGYAPASDQVQVASGAVTEVDVELRPLPRTGGVEGSVVDARTQAGIDGAEIRLFGPDGAVAARTTTNHDGIFVFDGVPGGDYVIVATHSAYRGAEVEITIVNGEVVSVSIALEALPTTGILEGVVRDAETQDGIAGAIVEVHGNGGVVEEVETNEHGVFIVDGLAPGRYSVLAQAVGYVPNEVGADVVAGAAVSVEIVLRPALGSLFGTITDAASGEALAGVRVLVHDASGNIEERTETSPNGAWAISGLPAGGYVVVFERQGYLSDEREAQVHAGGRTQVDIALRRAAVGLSGQVTDAQTQGGLGDVRVALIDGDDVAAVAHTNHDGFYAFDGVAPGDYVVTFQREGYEGAEEELRIPPGQEIELNVALQPRPAAIAGVVVDADTGEGLAGARVILFGAAGTTPLETETDRGGHFEFGELGAGSYVLEVLAEGYFSVEERVQVGPGQRVEVDIALHRAVADLRGQITDARTGAPVEGALVSVHTSGGAIAETQSNPNGHYAFEDLAPGDYVVTVEKDGYLGAEREVSLAPNQDVELDIALHPELGNIAGMVLGLDGGGLGDVTVTLFGAGTTNAATTITNAQGLFEFADLRPGVYELLFEKEGFGADERRVEVRGGQTAQVQVRLLPLGGVVFGKVRDADDNAGIAGAHVLLFGPAGTAPRETETNDEGRYRFENVPAGSYGLEAEAEGYFGGGAQVQLGPGEEAEADITLQSALADIRGTVFDGQGQGVLAGVEVNLWDSTGNLLATVHTNRNGRFAFESLSAGTYGLDFEKAGYAHHEQSVNLAAGQDVELDVVLQPAFGLISGRVFNGLSGDAIAGAEVVLIGTNGTAAETTTTNIDGFYAFDGLRAGEYIIEVHKSGFFGDERRVTLEAGDEVEASFELFPNAGAIVGTVTDAATQAPLAGVLVKLWDVGGNLLESATTDNTGHYAIDGLAPGGYVIEFHKSGYDGIERAVQVVGGQELVIDAALEQLQGALEGTVTARHNNMPLAGARVVVIADDIVVGEAETNGEGFYRIEGLAAGHYVAEFSAEGYASVETEVAIQAGQTSTKDKSLEAFPAFVFGQVTDAATQGGLHNVEVTVISPDGTAAKTGRTNHDGFYEIGDLAPGGYLIIFELDGYFGDERDFEVGPGGQVEVSLALRAVPPAPGELDGVVLDARTQAPIAGATVTLFGTGSVGSTTTTNPNGAFFFDQVPAGHYVVGVEAEGYAENEVEATVEAGERTEVTIALTPLPPPVGTVFGTVTAAHNQQPLAGVQVRVLSALFNLRTETNANGQYVIDGLPAGTHALSFEREGYEGTEGEVTIIAGHEEELSVTLEPHPGFVFGQVVDAVTQAGIAGGTVSLFGVAGTVVPTTPTDAQGFFEFPPQTPGNYVILFEAEGYFADEQELEIAPGGQHFVDGALQPVPPAVGTVFGTVTSAQTGQALAEVFVRIPSDSDILAATTNANGEYIIDGVPAGQHSIIFEREDHQAVEEGVLVVGGQDVEQNAQLEPLPASITVQPVDAETNAALTGAVVTLFGVAGTEPETLVVGESGQVIFDGLAPGNYVVGVEASGYFADERAVEVGPAGAAVVEVPLEAIPEPGSIEVSVVSGHTQGGINGATVNLFMNGNLIATATTNHDGIAEFAELVAGDYAMLAEAEGHQTEDAPALVEAGQTTQVTIVLPPEPAVLFGIVTEVGGAASISGATVSLTNATGVTIEVVQTTPNGFAFDGLTPGLYVVSASAEGYHDNVVDVTLGPGEQGQVTIALSPLLGEIFGTVTDAATGEAVVGALVTLTGADGIAINETETSDFGTYVFGGVRVGTYGMVVEHDAYETADAEVVVSASASSEVNFALEAPAPVTGGIQGTVFDAGGGTLAGAQITISGSTGLAGRTATSGLDGSFSFADLAPGVYILEASLEGYASNEVEVNVVAGSNAGARIFLTLLTGSIAGTVTDANTQAPIAGVVVTLWGGGPLQETTTDNTGSYSFDEVAPGQYSVTFEVAGYQATEIGVAVNADETAVGDASLNANAPAIGEVQGVVFDAAGGGLLAGVAVTVSQGGATIATATTDAAGFWSVDDLAVGDYDLGFTLAGYADASSTVTITAGDIAGHQQQMTASAP